MLVSNHCSRSVRLWLELYCLQTRWLWWRGNIASIRDPSHKYRNASDRYPTIHHFVTEYAQMYTFLLQNGALLDNGLVLCGGFATGLSCQYSPPKSNYTPTLSNRPSWLFLLEIKGTMMTSSNGNYFRVTGPLCGEFSGHRWIPLTKASNAELWCFLRSVPDQTTE